MKSKIESKKERFEQLIIRRKKCDRCSKFCKNENWLYNSSSEAELECDSIGRWTCWNGNLDAELMIVGQDWGTKNHLEEFREEQKKYGLPYEKDNTTNLNLAACIKQINSDWDILAKKDIENNERYPLFFTNEILCYKDEKYMNAKIPASCYKKCTEEFLLEEIDIVEPKAIVLLGSDAFKNFARVAGVQQLNEKLYLNEKFIKLVEKVLTDKLQLVYTTKSGAKVRVFPMCHVGGFGARNAKVAYMKNHKGEQPEPSARQVLEMQWKQMAVLLRD